MIHRVGRRCTAAAGLALAGACSNAGSGLGPDGDASTVTVQIYLDRDGSRTVTPVNDTVFASARVALLPAVGNDTLRVTNSNASGIARFSSVSPGQYRIGVTQSSIGDSIVVEDVSPATMQVTADGNTVVTVRLGYPELSIRQIRAQAPGRRVILRGIILAGVQSFRDTTSHVSDTSGQIRLTTVTIRAPFTGNNPGDTVSVLGVVSERAGQPTVDSAIISVLGFRPPPLPSDTLTASEATSAKGGSLDAAFVRVPDLVIDDTTSVGPDFLVQASDASGSMLILLDANLGAAKILYRPGRGMIVRGVLVPTGSGTWRLKPRATEDVGFTSQ